MVIFLATNVYQRGRVARWRREKFVRPVTYRGNWWVAVFAGGVILNHK